MGIQAFIKVGALRAAGCGLITYFETLPADEQYPATIVAETLVKFPCGASHYMHGAVEDGELWVDFNHWGGNRPVLEPLLTRHHIPWIEG